MKKNIEENRKERNHIRREACLRFTIANDLINELKTLSIYNLYTQACPSTQTHNIIYVYIYRETCPKSVEEVGHLVFFKFLKMHR